MMLFGLLFYCQGKVLFESVGTGPPVERVRILGEEVSYLVIDPVRSLLLFGINNLQTMNSRKKINIFGQLSANYPTSPSWRFGYCSPACFDWAPTMESQNFRSCRVQPSAGIVGWAISSEILALLGVNYTHALISTCGA